MRAEITRQLHQAAHRQELDAVVALSPEAIAYSCGFVIPSQPLMRWRHAARVLTRDGRDGLVCVDMEETTVRAQAPHTDLRVWAEFGGDPMATLAELLTDLGVAQGRIGLELDYLSTSDHTRLQQLLPHAVLAPCQKLLRDLRAVKLPTELDLLRRLARISDRAIADTFAEARAGVTEMDLASSLTRSVYAQGADQFKLMIVATGDRSELPNVGPTERELKPRDVCRMEIFSVIDGYHAGVCRTAVVDEAPPEAERIWANLVECKYLLLDAIKPGASSHAVWTTFHKKFSELGLPPIAFVGHGLGVDLHETPYIGPDSDTELRPGMVLGIEPLAYRTGHGFGMQLKDVVAVTENGCELLSDISYTDQLTILGR